MWFMLLNEERHEATFFNHIGPGLLQCSETLGSESGKVQEQIAHRSCCWPTPGSVQSFEKPDGRCPAHDSGIETRWSLRCLPAQSIVLFYDSVIIQKRELMQCTRKKTSMTGRIKRDIELSSD